MLELMESPVRLATTLRYMSWEESQNKAAMEAKAGEAIEDEMGM